MSGVRISSESPNIWQCSRCDLWKHKDNFDYLAVHGDLLICDACAARQAMYPYTSECYDSMHWIVVQDDGGDDNYIAHCWFNRAVNQWEITEQTLTILKHDSNQR